MTTPTAEQFRNVIADELEALAKRVREPTTRVDRAAKTGHVSISRDNAMVKTGATAEYVVVDRDMKVSIQITSLDLESAP